MSGLRLTVLPAKLTPAASFDCHRNRLTLTVGQCAGRFNGAAPIDDPCSGCEHGKRTAAFMRGAKDELELARERTRKKLRGLPGAHGGARPQRRGGKRARHDQLRAKVIALLTKAGEAGIASAKIALECQPIYTSVQVTHVLAKLRTDEVATMGERDRSDGHSFVYRLVQRTAEQIHADLDALVARGRAA